MKDTNIEEPADSPSAIHPFASVLRRYAFAYTAAHDFDVCREIMVDDYELRMGDAIITGRESTYIPAAQKQFQQFPGLGLTVHELVIGTNRAALRFTEHGHSVLHQNSAAWRGISLYRWNGQELSECRVEQDYYGRRCQQRTGIPDAIEPPGMDPWMVVEADTDSESEAVARDWLISGGVFRAPLGSIDNEHFADADRLVVDSFEVSVLDLFSAGSRVAFHTRTEGAYVSGLGLQVSVGVPVSIYATGLVTVVNGVVADARIVTDRLQVERRLSTMKLT